MIDHARREDLERRLEELGSERCSLGRPSLRFGASEASKLEIDEWKALHPELERRHAELVNEEADIGRRLQEAARRERVEARLCERLQAAGAGERSARHALAPEPRPAIEVVRGWLAKPQLWALVLCGTTGTGKTVAGVWAMAETFRKAGIAASRTPTAIGRQRGARERDDLKHLCSVDLLLVDDLGAAGLSARERGLVFELLNARYEATSRTIITSNLGLSQLQALLGERIMDRFRDGGRVVDVSGKSMRGQLRQLEIGDQLAAGQAGLSTTTETDR